MTIGLSASKCMLALENKFEERKQDCIVSPEVRVSAWLDLGRASFSPPRSRRQKESLFTGWISSVMTKFYWIIIRFWETAQLPLPKQTLGSLSKDVFERRTSTGSEAFSLFIRLDTTKFVLLSFFSPMKTIYLRVSTKPQPNAAKSQLPVDVRHSKTLLLKLPINTYFSLRAKCWLRGGVGGQCPRNVPFY